MRVPHDNGVLCVSGVQDSLDVGHEHVDGLIDGVCCTVPKIWREDSPAILSQLTAEGLPNALDLACSVQEDDRPRPRLGYFGSPVIFENTAQRTEDGIGKRC